MFTSKKVRTFHTIQHQKLQDNNDLSKNTQKFQREPKFWEIAMCAWLAPLALHARMALLQNCYKFGARLNYQNIWFQISDNANWWQAFGKWLFKTKHTFIITITYKYTFHHRYNYDFGIWVFQLIQLTLECSSQPS